MTASSELPAAIAAFFDAINTGDATATGRTFTEDVSYQLLVPYPAVVGRTEVVAALRGSLDEADHVRWDVVSFAVGDDVAHVERIDRFWFGEREAAIECTGVFELSDGLICAVRDYADLGTWRERKAAAVGQ